MNKFADDNFYFVENGRKLFKQVENTVGKREIAQFEMHFFQNCAPFFDLEWYPAYRSVRREEVIIAHLRIGHSHLTHSWLLTRDDPPECVPCSAEFSIKHILNDCIDFQPICSRHFSSSSIKDLFDTVRIESIIAYLKEIGLYNRL